ncbi:hypothetical protein GALMADRAFT_237904 [Galerina marginata CBS 339.88]|uniref:Uncharacterized protein n=1 Tax=Galerina marginata (strain CBS 339.88) TaxID=685588 RepID=A0A067TUA4_GALM3|nr:hypothetical protein GALMADRAFT_237904 [Galerina marginata CBS 339.88]
MDGLVAVGANHPFFEALLANSESLERFTFGDCVALCLLMLLLAEDAFCGKFLKRALTYPLTPDLFFIVSVDDESELRRERVDVDTKDDESVIVSPSRVSCWR